MYKMLNYSNPLMIYFTTCITLDDVRLKYKQLILKHHPDRSKQCHSTFLQIRAEYEYLQSNPFLLGMRRQPLYSYREDDLADASIYCVCGGLYDLNNKLNDIVECMYCSHYIEVLG